MFIVSELQVLLLIYNVPMLIKTELENSISGQYFSIRGFGLTRNSIIFIAFKGISLKAAAVSVKKESEDPTYYQYNVQGNTVL